MIDRWADIVATRARLVLVAGILVVVGAATYGLGVFDALSQGGFDDPDSESGRELALERDTFGNQNVDVLVLYGADGGDVFDPAVAGPVSEVVEALPDDAVRTVVSYLAVPGPDGQPSPEAAAEAGLVSADGDTGQVLISLVGEDQDALLSSYREIEEDLEVDAAGVTTSVTGAFAVYSDVNEITSEDLERAEIISMPVVLLLALLIFGSLVAASMPVLVGLVAMVGALAVVRLLTEFTAVSVFSVNVVSLLGIGLAIDYAPSSSAGSARSSPCSRTTTRTRRAPPYAARSRPRAAPCCSPASPSPPRCRACSSSRRCSCARWASAAWPRCSSRCSPRSRSSRRCWCCSAAASTPVGCPGVAAGPSPAAVAPAGPRSRTP